MDANIIVNINNNVQYHLLRENMAHREYSLKEYQGMQYALVLADYHFRFVEHLYRYMYPGLNRYPDYRVFVRLHDRMNRCGCLVPNHQYGGRYARVDLELENLVLAAFRENSNLSTKVCAVRLGTYHVMVHSILRFHGMKPYRYQKVQALMGPDDFVARRQFCLTILEMRRLGWDIASLILFTDECTFTNNGMHNQRNYVSWADHNPQ